ncbi:MAG: hypothetical protein CL912_26920 [Deltaproteobacteria bacterium]|nr:hypothetical protein [Deltaproteobacteria bacterium]
MNPAVNRRRGSTELLEIYDSREVSFIREQHDVKNRLDSNTLNTMQTRKDEDILVNNLYDVSHRQRNTKIYRTDRNMRSRGKQTQPQSEHLNVSIIILS